MSDPHTPPGGESGGPEFGRPAEPFLNAVPPELREMDQQARTMGMLAHLAALAGYMIPFGNIVGPLLVWLIKKDEMPFVNDQGKESLNFQITVMGLVLICTAIGIATCGVGFVITGPLMVGIGIVALVFSIIAAVKANDGVYFRYPFNLRFIR